MRWHRTSSPRLFVVLMSLLGLAAALPMASLVSPTAFASSTCTSTRSTNDSDEQALIAMINNYRSQSGLSRLTVTPGLTRAAISKSADMAATGVFAHDSISDTMARFAACGNNSAAIGENIAAGNTDPTATFQQWKNSAEHNANMLSPTFTAIGMGRAFGTYSSGGQTFSNYAFWTTEFGNAVDSGLPSGNSTIGNSAPPPSSGVPAPGIVTPSTSTSGGLVGYGSFSGGGGYVPSGPPSTSTSGGLVGYGSFPGGGYVPSAPTAPTLPQSGQGGSVGYGSFP